MEYALVTKSWHKLTLNWLVSLDLKMACYKYVVYNNLPRHPTYLYCTKQLNCTVYTVAWE